MRGNMLKLVGAACLALLSQASFGQTFSSGMPAGWTGVGAYGTSGANGVVTLAPGGGSQYGWVSTTHGVNGASPFHFGSETNGSYLRSTVFAANGGAALNFNFNYVTSDGAGFADYAWARLLNASDLSQAALLFTARTTPGGNTVPGFGMPLPEATVGTSVIHGGSVSWAPLDPNNSGCYNSGCGYTGWVNSTYSIASAGNYVLEFGVTNWSDTAWNSGLAFDGITIAGTPINAVPEPETYALMLAGLGVMGAVARRRKSKQA